MSGRFSNFRWLDNQVPSKRSEAAIFLASAVLHLQNRAGEFPTEAGIILQNAINEIAISGTEVAR
jgi:hypothetical protein